MDSLGLRLRSNIANAHFGLSIDLHSDNDNENDQNADDVADDIKKRVGTKFKFGSLCTSAHDSFCELVRSRSVVVLRYKELQFVPGDLSGRYDESAEISPGYSCSLFSSRALPVSSLLVMYGVNS